MPELPKVDALLLCDHVHWDPASGKYSLLGVLDRVFVTAFPALLQTIGVYGRLTNMRGDYEIVLRLAHGNDDEPIIEARAGAPIVVHDPLSVTEIGFNQVEFSLPTAGVYHLELFANGELIHNVTIRTIERGGA